ncbi:MAG: hypothetical protein ACRD72_24320, partial [Candidatus Angelobacter sp.]
GSATSPTIIPVSAPIKTFIQSAMAEIVRHVLNKSQGEKTTDNVVISEMSGIIIQQQHRSSDLYSL